MKIAKMHYFSRFFTKFKKLCVNFFARLDETDKLLETLRKFSKIFENFKNFLQKIVMNALF